MSGCSFSQKIFAMQIFFGSPVLSYSVFHLFHKCSTLYFASQNSVLCEAVNPLIKQSAEEILHTLLNENIQTSNVRFRPALLQTGNELVFSSSMINSNIMFYEPNLQPWRVLVLIRDSEIRKRAKRDSSTRSTIRGLRRREYSPLSSN